jgi:hypothetical protein
MLNMDPMFAGLGPAKGDRTFKGNKYPQNTFFQKGSKAVGPIL